MTRTLTFAALLATLAACASAGNPDPGAEPAERVTTMVTTTSASGQTTTTPVTTYTDPGMRSVEIQGTPDNVFRVLPAAYKALGMEVVTSDPPNRTAGNTQIRARRNLGSQSLSYYLDCGTSGLSGPAADIYPVRLSVVSTVTPTGSTSRLRTVVRAAYATAEQSGTTPCNTTGALESAIARAVQLELVRG